MVLSCDGSDYYDHQFNVFNDLSLKIHWKLLYYSDRQCRLRSVCSLIKVYTVCYFFCILWTLYHLVKSQQSNFRIITAKCFGCQIFSDIYSITVIWMTWLKLSEIIMTGYIIYLKEKKSYLPHQPRHVQLWRDQLKYLAPVSLLFFWTWHWIIVLKNKYRTRNCITFLWLHY